MKTAPKAKTFPRFVHPTHLIDNDEVQKIWADTHVPAPGMAATLDLGYALAAVRVVEVEKTGRRFVFSYGVRRCFATLRKDGRWRETRTNHELLLGAGVRDANR